MPLKRKAPFALPVPADNSPIPAPLLTFKTQPIKAGLTATGGLYSYGSIKFSLNNVQMVELAKEAFTEFSNFKTNSDALNAFLFSLSNTSKLEGGFDSLNTWDNAGISLGAIQFARPEGGVGRLLELVGRKDMADTIRARFGIADPHNSALALKARFDQAFLKTIVAAVTTPESLIIHFGMAINQNVGGQFYFDKAYSRAQELKLKDPWSIAMLFDASVNMGVGKLTRFSMPTSAQTEGDWIKASIPLFTRPERRKAWQNIVAANFI